MSYPIPRILKNEVGRCKICHSSAVVRKSNCYSDKKYRYSVVCCNPYCGKITSGYSSVEPAITDWKEGWGKI